MRTPPETSSDPARQQEAEPPLWKRLGWMAAIWLGSVAVLGLIASIIRFWLNG